MSQIIGLNGNGIFINNPILVSAIFTQSGNPVPLKFLVVRITNASTQEFTEIKTYPLFGDNKVRIDLSPILKSMFKKPVHDTSYSIVTDESNNREVFNFSFIGNYEISGIPYSQILNINNKAFFRGGYRTNLQNHGSVIGSRLNSTPVIPYWSGYPVAEYKVITDFKIEKNPIIDNISDRERRYVKGCNPVYVKFLNSLGGYSYWLFEGLTNNSNTNNLGYSNSFNETIDFGNDLKRSLQLYSKVPVRFYPLMLDLIESQEIYVYNYAYQPWARIINNNNSLSENDAKKNYEVKLNFEVVSNYNPSLLWSN